MAVFASANAIRKYTMAGTRGTRCFLDLDGPRISAVELRKLQGHDSTQLTHELRQHGIRVQGSTIIGLEHHTPDNIRDEIEYAVAHDTDFHQFMLYTPVPGTPLFQEISAQGRMLEGVDFADIHGQHKFNFKHAAISRDDSKRFLDWAFWRDFERNGPSLSRMCETMLQGWRRYKNYPDLRVRERFARENAKLRTVYSAALWAAERYFHQVNKDVSRQIHELRREIGREFGLMSRIISSAMGPVLLWSTRREDRRLASGVTYEPPTIIERRNWTPTPPFRPQPDFVSHLAPESI